MTGWDLPRLAVHRAVAPLRFALIAWLGGWSRLGDESGVQSSSKATLLFLSAERARPGIRSADQGRPVRAMWTRTVSPLLDPDMNLLGPDSSWENGRKVGAAQCFGNIEADICFLATLRLMPVMAISVDFIHITNLSTRQLPQLRSL